MTSSCLPPFRKRWTVNAMMLVGLFSSTAGCTRWYDPESVVPISQAWRRISPDEAPVVFSRDASVPILSARRQAFGKLTETYEITLENSTVLPGENSIRLEVRHRPTSMLTSLTTLSEPFASPRYDERVMASRLQQEFPTLRARVEPDLRQNRYGMYSYATATDGYVACVLAWQVIDDNDRVLPPSFALLRTEYRFCAPGVKPVQLLAKFDRATLFFGGHMMPEPEVGTAQLGRMDAESPPSPDSRPVSSSGRWTSTSDKDRLLDLSNPVHAQTMQLLLKDMGLYDGQIDGIWGQRSRKALQAFKAVNSST